MQNTMKTYLEKFSESLFTILLTTEELGLFLHSEDSLFLRFNGSKIRQNTTVSQHEITMTLQTEKKSIQLSFNLNLDFNNDIQLATKKILQARIDLKNIDERPKFVALTNNGTSTTIKKIERPRDEEIPSLIADLFSDADLAGLWCSGPLRRASLNSKGQFHYFETDYFFFDYSLYNGPKAAKGFYSSEKFELQKFKEQSHNTKNKLALLLKPTIEAKPGQHRVYLEPMAVAEILGTMSWGALSEAAFRQGRAPLKKLKEKELKLSEKFSLLENFNLGFSPLFNSIGEISASEISLIKNGLLENLLISTQTATEYGLISNQAGPGEFPRSLEVRAGTLNTKEILTKLGTGLYLSNLHYINWSDLQTARMTGMTRFACFWVENGEIQGPISDLRFDETVFNIFGQGLVEVTTEQEIFVDISTYQKRSLGVVKVPGILVDNFNFTL